MLLRALQLRAQCSRVLPLPGLRRLRLRQVLLTMPSVKAARAALALVYSIWCVAALTTPAFATLPTGPVPASKDFAPPTELPAAKSLAQPVQTGSPGAAGFEKYVAERNAVDQKYYKAYYDYLARINDVQINKFVWQDRASEVTLWLVVIVVVSGLAMSGFQLWIAFRRPDHSTDTTIDLSAQKFRVTSSVVGIVVLIISIGFLFLFLREVYDIKMVSSTENSGPAGVAASALQQKPVAGP